MKEAQIKLSIIGEPVITELAYNEQTGFVEFQIMAVGVPDGSLSLKITDEYLSITLDQKVSLTEPFAVTLYSNSLKFRMFEYQKEYGLITLYIPVREIEPQDLEPIVINL